MEVQVFSQFNNFSLCGSPTPCALAFTSDIMAGLQRVYNRRAAHNFTAANLSLGGQMFTSNCDNDPLKPIIDSLLCGCQVANAQMLLCFFFLLNHPRPKRDLLLCVARHTAVTLTRNAPLSKAPSPGISVSRVEPSGVFVSLFCLSSSCSLGCCLLLGQGCTSIFVYYLVRLL